MKCQSKLLKYLLCIFYVITTSILIMETSSYLIIKNNIIKIGNFKKNRLINNFPAQFKLSYPELYENFIGFAPHQNSSRFIKDYSNSIDKINPKNYKFRPYCIEWYYKNEVGRVPFYPGEVPHFIKIEYEKNTTTTYDTFQDLIGSLIKKSNNKKIIITLGGSTTACITNWPFYLYQNAKELKIKDDFIVINLGMQRATLTEMIEITKDWINDFSKYIKIDIIVSLNGFNETYGRIGSSFDVSEINNLNVNKFLSSEIFINIKKLIIKIFPYTMTIILNENYPSNQNVRIDQDGNKYVKISDNLLSNIMSKNKIELKELNKLSKMRGAIFLSYLQPIAYSKYYKFNDKRNSIFKNSDYSLQVGASSHSMEYIIEPKNIYEKMELVYSNLQKKDRNSYKNIAYSFNDYEEDFYSDDSVHYSKKASSIIARNIVIDLKQKGFLK